MHYRFAILDLCDECRLTLLKTPSISSKYMVKDMAQGTTNNCQVCGKVNVFTMSVLTDYRVDHVVSSELKNQKRNMTDGFALLLLEDKTECTKPK